MPQASARSGRTKVRASFGLKIYGGFRDATCEAGDSLNAAFVCWRFDILDSNGP